MERRFRLQSEEEGKRLDRFLSEKLSITRSKIKQIFEQGLVRIEGKIPKPSLKVRKGLIMEGRIPEDKPISLAPEEVFLDILYEDEFFLAVNKPKGMVVHPSFGHGEGTLVNAILGYLQRTGDRRWTADDGLVSRVGTQTPPGEGGDGEHRGGTARPGIVHRLDKDTTGVILVAKDLKTQETLSRRFKERTVHKTYRAIVEGTVKDHEGIITGNIGRHPIHRKKMAVLSKGGRESETAYTIIAGLDGYTYVEAYPRTGRTHQIRVHFAHIGHAVVGDGVYGKKGRHMSDRPLLHAHVISFRHPVTELPVVIEAPVPEDMIRFVAEHEKAKGTGAAREKSRKETEN